MESVTGKSPKLDVPEIMIDHGLQPLSNILSNIISSYYPTSTLILEVLQYPTLSIPRAPQTASQVVGVEFNPAMSMRSPGPLPMS